MRILDEPTSTNLSQSEIGVGEIKRGGGKFCFPGREHRGGGRDVTSKKSYLRIVFLEYNTFHNSLPLLIVLDIGCK